MQQKQKRFHVALHACGRIATLDTTASDEDEALNKLKALYPDFQAESDQCLDVDVPIEQDGGFAAKCLERTRARAQRLYEEGSHDFRDFEAEYYSQAFC